jgi:hypothetical protein
LKNTLGQTFTFHAKDIHYTCPSHFKLQIIPSQTISFDHELSIKKDMLIELCAGNYIISNGFVNGVDGILKVYT